MLGNLTLTQHRLGSASHHATGLTDGDATGSSGSKRKRTWSRAVFSNLQRKGLEKRFDVQKYVTKPDRRQLASLLGLTDAQVKVWFQNRRMKWRHQMEAKKKEEKSKPKSKESDPKPKTCHDDNPK
ncbi:hypothetical protein CAPTEDRAFT_173964 [Capitella teleta]|uniref:Homeobox domain-containing protein n=1 Tax=Capitella teleta TaxID=283909 RepID=R7V240_CAPTE|nr:hypothetical protein CAPTEDRAFT_173964 [Capitella teleta]|eukprot:ELU12918.1 hypothetical protein CAPTEDRAFT_173964 [Capitella teleta]